MDDGQIGVSVQPEQSAAAPAEVQAFVVYYLQTPAGPGTLKLGEARLDQERHLAIRVTFEAWRALQGRRDGNGRLKNSVGCIAYSDRDGEKCINPTKDPSGLCRHHNKAGISTLFTYEPFTARERSVKSVDRIDREAKWKHVAARISYTATDRQIYFLLDLGATPQQLEGITKQEASALIDRMLGK